MTTENYVNLGKTNIKISPIGLGIMQWGDIKLTDNQDDQADPITRQIFLTSLEMGITFFDTAEMYGNGRSERHLGMDIKDKPDGIVIATKFMPYPWRISKTELRSALTRSLDRLGMDHVDLYQMHWPIPPVPISTWMDAMSEVYAAGLIRAVGVSNYSIQQVELAQKALARHGIPLASNQIKFSLLDQHHLASGLVDYCRQAGITIIAYSPLEKGMLTGKYSQANPPSGFRAWRYSRSYLEKITPLLNELEEIGKQTGGRTLGQVSLNWLMEKGAVPIPGARNVAQAKENAGAQGWHLTTDQMTRLDKISQAIMR